MFSYKERLQIVKLSLYILDNEEMSLIGKLTNIGLTETLKSVRFRGDIAYIVTFFEVQQFFGDPLFIIDLSNPKKPAILGELEIPGFSSYLHPYRNDLLSGVGREIDEENGEDLGLKLSLFDIKDPSTMKEVNKMIFPGRNTRTSATSDPRAFMFDLDKGIRTFPIEYNHAGEKWAGGIVIELSENGFQVGKKLKMGSFFSGSFNSRFVYIDDLIYYLNEKNIVIMDYNTYNRVST